MIGSLRGEIIERDIAGTVLIEVSGVGYVVSVTERTLGELEPSTTAFLYVHHHIREDTQQLFGFLHRAERDAFKSLIAAHGVGPAMAMAILATHTPSALIDIVAERNLAALTLVPGVGKKTAERLLIELANKLSIPVLDGVVDGGGSSALADVREALIGLGYAETEIRDTLREVPNDGDAGEVLREALKVLGAKRA